MASALASIDLLLLCLMVLSLGLLETPVPRAWAGAAVALLVLQTASMHAMGLEAQEPAAARSDAIVGSVAEAIALLVVPAGTAALLTVIFYHCARAFARAKHRAQAIGSDMPTG